MIRLGSILNCSGMDGRDKPGHDGWRARLACAIIMLVASPAHAQSPPSRSYKATTAIYDRTAENDAGLVAVVKATRVAVEAKDAAALSALLSAKFVALECAANPLVPCAPGKAKAMGARNARPIDRLRLAFCCEGEPSPETPVAAQNETMFAILAAILGAGGLGANPDGKGEICAPALPRLDRVRAGAAARAAGVEPENLRAAAVEIPLRAKPAPGADTIARLAPGDLAPIVTDLTADTPSGWSAIALPDGAIGYTDALGLDELTPAAICWAKEKAGWKIVSAIQRSG